MEENKLITRDQLKTYFETGKYPTQNQFSDLIDSLRLKEDALTDKDVVILANSLAAINKGSVQYTINDDIDLKLSLLVNQQEGEDQVIKMDYTYGGEKTQYFWGDAPYTLTIKELSQGKLAETEYYNLRYSLGPNFESNRLFGNNLPEVPEGFELGKMEGKRSSIRINKQRFWKKIDIINTHIEFVNKTEVPIEYRPEASYWNHQYTAKDLDTHHYDVDDSFYFYYKADLRAIEQSIQCRLYDADNGNLLMTGYLNAGQNNPSAWGGGQTHGVRNIRIECDYYVAES
ncbi:hypothetical protein [Chryseobacterium lactis]|uniref:hypothetical protein n=1 Tax=Chryseobacterium lactis TaxID=1241981 RepID=UPI00162AF1F3|nr:hypothetical protein [Chryseobacterium lactis]